jgi:ureidoglycolate lyase
MTREEFIDRFGGVFEHSPWIAARAFDAGPVGEPLTAPAVHGAMAAQFRSASADEQLAVLRAHPDLAGRLAIAGELTEDSRKEQAGAGLDRLSPAEHARFTALNAAYVEKFGFPFIIAVKGLTKDDILSAFEVRIGNSGEQEFETAKAQVERIAHLRLAALLPGETTASVDPTGVATTTLPVLPLTKEAFAPFGTVIEADPSTMRQINGGTTERYHALAEADVTGPDARVIINIFRGSPRAFPYAVDMMERHPLGSQSFSPIDDRPWLVVVAEDENGRPGRPRVFLASGRQGVNYRRNVWHHPLMAVGAASDFLVVDRSTSSENLEEHFYAQPFVIEHPGVTE